jgi:hypothetical protein
MAEETGIDLVQVWVAMRALRDAGYVEAYLASAHSGFVQSVGERTRRELGSWPSAKTMVDALASALADLAEREPDLERKSKLRAAADALGGIVRAAAVGEVQALLRKYGAELPLP